MTGIYRYQTGVGRGRFIIASYNEENGQYTAGMTEDSCELTGCYAEYARSVEALAATGNVQTYSTLGSARRALHRLG